MRKKLIKLIEHIVVPYFATEIADHLIENDAVIVVRCKDCKHWEHEEDVDFVCKRHYGYRASLDFCSQGERKETTP